jgi:CHAT domain-containing protein/tetratricopeptide (TPR) repeat protein
VRSLLSALALLWLGAEVSFAQPVTAKQRLIEAERLASPQVRRAASSLPLFREAIALSRDAGDETLEARGWTGLGGALINIHRPAEAEQALQTGITLAQRSGAVAEETTCLLALANLAQERGDFDLQVHYVQRTIDLGGRTRNLPARLRGLNSYCSVLRRNGRTAEAVRIGRQMLGELDAAIRSKADFPSILLFQVPYNLGRALVDHGEPSEGMMLLERAREAAEMQGTLAGIWHCLHDAAEIYAHQGDIEAASRFYARALEIARKIDSRDPEAETLRGLGEVAESHGDVESAMQHYRTALDVLERAQVNAEIPETLIGLSRVQWRAGHLSEAQGTLRRAIDLAESSQQFSVLALASLELGKQQYEAGKLQSARMEYQRALEITRSNGLRILTPLAWGGIAAAERRLGHHPQALAAYRAAADAVDQIRARIPSEHQRISFATKTHALYGDWIDLLLELKQPEQAFVVLERERNRTLIDALTEVEPAASANHRVGELESRVADIQIRLNAAELSVPARRALLHQLEDAERRLDLERPGNVSAQPSLSLAQMQNALQPGELFVAYSARPEVVVAFVVTRESLRHFRAVLPELDSRVAMFNHALAESNEETALRAGKGLSEPLIHPLRLARKPTRVVFSPAGDLSALPFAALPDPVTGRPLMQSVEVAYVPSLFALALQRSRRPASLPNDLMAVAPLNALPETLQEISRISRLAGPGADLLVEDNATETAVKLRPLHQYKVLHFASHAVLDPQFPSRSAIELARQGSQDDGKLQVREIYRLDLSDQLVVLSACATAYGRISAAEGMQSLARAFTHAGARTVVGTLWKVEDRAAARFMELMYAELASGNSVSSSLRAAQQAIATERPYDSAALWAPWMATGDPAHTVALRGSSLAERPVFAAVGLLVLVAAALTVANARRVSRKRER